MEGKNGINVAIIKGDPNQGLTSEDEKVLLKKNYQNLEELIQTLMADQRDDNYLKLAKLNNLAGERAEGRHVRVWERGGTRG